MSFTANCDRGDGQRCDHRQCGFLQRQHEAGECDGIRERGRDYKTVKLAVGTNSVTAVYNGSKFYAKSTSNVVSEVVGNGQFIDSTMTFDGVTRYYEVYLPATMWANPAMLLCCMGRNDIPKPAGGDFAELGMAERGEHVRVYPGKAGFDL